MGHDSSRLLMNDILFDFPVNALLQRVGLLETLLDVIGSAVLNDETKGYIITTIFYLLFLLLLFSYRFKWLCSNSSICYGMVLFITSKMRTSFRANS